MNAVAALLFLAVAPSVLAAKPAKPAISADVREDREEMGKLHRELASALLVKRLDLTPTQKTDLLRVIADAKALRAERQGSKDFDAMREKRKELLQRAIDDARKTGEVSAQTKVAMEEMRGDVKDARDVHQAKAKELKERLRKVLTAEQVEELKELREDMPGPGRMRGGKAGKKGHGGGFLRLLLSDEFEAELKR